MWRWVLVGLLILAAGFAGGLVIDHWPRPLTLALVLVLGLPAGLLMEANLDRRREQRRGRTQ